jgi:hypothetical protein
MSRPPSTPNELRDYLRNQVAAVLHKVGPDRPLSEFGLDSLMAQQIPKRVQRDLG